MSLPPLAYSLEQAAGWLRVEVGEDDEAVLACLRAAQDHFEKQTAVALTPRIDVALEYVWPPGVEPFEFVAFPVHAVRIFYENLDGNIVQMPASDVQLRQPSSGDRRARAVPQGQWPVSIWKPGSEIRIEVDCGFPSGLIPESAGQAVRTLLAHFYKHREAVAMGAAVSEVPLGANAMMANWRELWVV